MRKLNFPVYEADNHIYEPESDFLRHLPKQVEKHFYFAAAAAASIPKQGPTPVRRGRSEAPL